ncbi:transcription factor TGAL5-like isoform X1 [Musa acuminata AAA Group]|uniref:transcription factor TGAL5-like isoform X1 n=1 Tax=Musa acuminata AAA Group TaxID=214697 RepID=UPI0031DEF774
MVQEGEETWIADHRVGETGLSDPRLSTHGIHGTTPAATKFFDQEEASYFGGLEEALMDGVDGIRETEDTFLTARPPTLQIFPSWPMRFQQSPRQGSLWSARSSASSSAQNTASHPESDNPASRMASSDLCADHKQQQEVMMRKMTGSTARKDGKVLDPKRLRRLAQNREAARKSRLRKKAYVQQLETSRIRLQQLEQDLHSARLQGVFLGVAGCANGSTSSSAAMFDMEYARWLDENCKHMSGLQGAIQAHLPDGDLGVIVDQCAAHYDELFRLKAIVVKSDVLYLLNGAWRTPAERCFLWMGGFRPSELLKMVVAQLDPLTEQQFMGICNLQQSSQQAEEALSQGLEQLHHSLADAIAGGFLSNGVADGSYMVIALGKLDNLEGLVRQADKLRQQSLHQLRSLFTTIQAAKCFLAIGEYYARLRALSSLWASRPRESLIRNDGVVSTSTDLQIVHQPLQNHFPYLPL